ncbi:MAG: carboxypeptidase-like regulatory domain-containing protein, partial [Akkermansiaceae bacterium]|nr:carboxypeptidase-like regulatory domain-containing protein [Akkermansiaceae bacterium]
MNNNFKILAISLLVILIVSLAILFRSCTKDETGKDVRPATRQDGVSHPDSMSKEERKRILSMTKEEREQEHKSWMKKKWEAAFGTPVNFWGKVVDQDGNPIQGARIEITLQDDPIQHADKINNTKHTKTSDANGHFELLRKKGATLYAKASKEGYSSLDGKTEEGNLSERHIYYAFDKVLPRYQPLTKNNPT